MSARIRESRLSHALGELEHELATTSTDVQLAKQLRDRHDIVNSRIQQIYFELDEQQERRSSAAAERAAATVEAGAVKLRDLLRRVCPEKVRAADETLAALCRDAGL